MCIAMNLDQTLNECVMLSVKAQEARLKLASKTKADVFSGRQAHYNLLALARLACFHRLA